MDLQRNFIEVGLFIVLRVSDEIECDADQLFRCSWAYGIFDKQRECNASRKSLTVLPIN